MINTSENTFYKQMSQQTSNPATPSPIQNMSFSGAGLNDAILGGSYNQITIATFVITAVAGSPNKFSWVETGGSGSSASNVNMTGSAQTLADGVTITFPATTGHTAGNTWTIVAIPTAREFWNSAGLKQVIWTDGSVVTMTGAGGAIFNPASPGTIGATTPGIIHTTSAILHGSTSGTVTLNPPAIAGTQAYTLPTGYPGVSGYALTCTTGGVMSWAAVSANWASPDAAIGTGTPVAGTFTALTANVSFTFGTGADLVTGAAQGGGGGRITFFKQDGLTYADLSIGSWRTNSPSTSHMYAAQHLDFASAGHIRWCDDTNVFLGTQDTGIKRSAAGVVSITNASTGAGRLKIGTSAMEASAIADFESTTKGIALPRMTEVQRDAISSPAEGLIVYNLTSHKLNIRVAAAWEELTSA